MELGYGTGSTKEGSYRFVSLLPRVGLDLGEALALAGLRPPGTLEVVFEPLLNVSFEPGIGVEGGLGLLFKYGCRLGRFMPYVEGGAGVITMDDLVQEQAGGVNFIPQIGPGLHLFITPNWALTVGYRFRHLSDCGLDPRNHGINSSLFLVGASFIFAPEPAPAFTGEAGGGIIKGRETCPQ